jgi:hypothetical protein
MKEELDEAVQTLVNDYTLQGLEYVEAVRMKSMNHALRGSEKSREAVDLSVRYLLEVRSAIDIVKARLAPQDTWRPTIAGLYLDNEGEVWQLDAGDDLYRLADSHILVDFQQVATENYAPYRLLSVKED